MRTVAFLLWMLSCVLSGITQQPDIPTLPSTIKVSFPGQGDSISLDALLHARHLTVSNKAFTILSFTMSFGGLCTDADGGMYGEVPCLGDSLSSEAIRLIRRFPPGYKISFDKVLVQNTIGKKYYLQLQSMKIHSGKPLATSKP